MGYEWQYLNLLHADGTLLFNLLTVFFLFFFSLQTFVLFFIFYSFFGYLYCSKLTCRQSESTVIFLFFFPSSFCEKDNSNPLFLNIVSNEKVPKVNMHRLIILREKGRGLLYMDIELQQHKLHMQALLYYILLSKAAFN